MPNGKTPGRKRVSDPAGRPVEGPKGPTHIGGPLDAVMSRIVEAQQQAAAPPVERMAYRMNDLPLALGVSRRTIERERAAGRFPGPDRFVGKAPLWTRETLARWLAEGGSRR